MRFFCGGSISDLSGKKDGLVLRHGLQQWGSCCHHRFVFATSSVGARVCSVSTAVERLLYLCCDSTACLSAQHE
jgi:hypothetical protein